MAGTASHLWSELAVLTRRPEKPALSDSDVRGAQDVARSEWKPTGDPLRVVEEGHRKVIRHYQELLRTQVLAVGERATIEERIARENVALDQMSQFAASSL